MRQVVSQAGEMVDQILWRELRPDPAHQSDVYAQALILNPHLVDLPAVLPAGVVITLPERPAALPAEAVDIIRVFS